MSISSLFPSNNPTKQYSLACGSVQMANPGETTPASTSLSYYGVIPQAAGVTVQFFGPWASPISRLVGFTRVGNLVVMRLDTYSGTATAGTAAGTTGTPIPEEFRPLSTTSFLGAGMNNNVEISVVYDILDDGSMIVTPVGASTFTGAGTCEFGDTCLTYSLA